jgi:alpha,alpha-trehalase
MDFQPFFPEKAYPELYADVMKFRIFEDSKTFADAVPLAPVSEIISAYQGIDHSDHHQVRDFVHQWFQIPDITSFTIPKADSVKEHIHSLWRFLMKEWDETKTISSLVPLPYPYIVPGGRFREIYYWDSYFTMLGLRESGEIEMILSMVKNFAWQLDHIGRIPNGNRSYFLSRSQPPFFSLMVTLLAGMNDELTYIAYLPELLREYAFWMDGIERKMKKGRRIIDVGNNQYLNRYYDDLNEPRTESFEEDVRLYNENSGQSDELYRNLRSACESGWDFSSRWLAKVDDLGSIRTTQMIPIDLNALLYMLEKTIEKAHRMNGNEIEAGHFESFATQRSSLINELMWDDQAGIYNDLIIDNSQFGTPSLAMMFPLFAGLASQSNAGRTVEYLSAHFLRPGGWMTTAQYTGQQWDAPNGWAPLQWIVFIALKKYGFIELAREGASRWLALNENVFNRTGRMMEKYNVEDLSLEAGGGEYPVQDGFGWTNGVYLALSKELEEL